MGNFQDLTCFNFENRSWRKQDALGVDARFFSSLSVYEKSIFVFGGRNIHSFAFNDVLRAKVAEAADEEERGAELAAMMESGELADLVFVTPDDVAGPDEVLAVGPILVPKEFSRARRVFAHRAVVCTRCATLATMLSSEMRERSGVVALAGTTLAQVHALLVYLYTDSVCVNNGNDLMGLLGLANMYQLPHLKHLCQQRMEQYLTLDNVMTTLEASSRLDASSLFSVCRSFIARNTNLLNVQMLPPELQASISAVHSPPRMRRLVE